MITAERERTSTAYLCFCVGGNEGTESPPYCLPRLTVQPSPLLRSCYINLNSVTAASPAVTHCLILQPRIHCMVETKLPLVCCLTDTLSQPTSTTSNFKSSTKAISGIGFHIFGKLLSFARGFPYLLSLVVFWSASSRCAGGP